MQTKTAYLRVVKCPTANPTTIANMNTYSYSITRCIKVYLDHAKKIPCNTKYTGTKGARAGRGGGGGGVMKNAAQRGCLVKRCLVIASMIRSHAKNCSIWGTENDYGAVGALSDAVCTEYDTV